VTHSGSAQRKQQQNIQQRQKLGHVQFVVL
jgi:hypothetical protein